MDLFKLYRKYFLTMAFADGGEGGGAGSTPNPTPNDGGAQPTPEPTPTIPTPQGKEGQDGSQNETIEALKKRVTELESSQQAQQQQQDLLALVEETKSELKQVEAVFPEWNEAEQQRTIQEMAKMQVELAKSGKTLGERYRGVSGALYFWKEHLQGNPVPHQNASGYTITESDKQLLERAGKNERLTQEERIAVLNLMQQGV